MQIKTQKTPSTVSELISYLGTICKTEHSELKVQEHLETQKNKLFKEKDLPSMTVCKDGLLLLCTATKRGEFCTGIIEYFKNNSLSLVKHSIYKMKKSSSSEYFVHLKCKTYLRVAFKKEFYTRALKIKYRDSSIDMTKFVNQKRQLTSSQRQVRQRQLTLLILILPLRKKTQGRIKKFGKI